MYLFVQVAHTSELKTTKDIIDLIRKEPEKVQLDWILRLVQHHVEQDPNKIYIVDLLPNLKWLQRNEYMSNNASELLGQLEEKVSSPVLSGWVHHPSVPCILCRYSSESMCVATRK